MTASAITADRRSLRHSCREVDASTTFEIEVGLTGTFQRGYPATGPTYDCGGEPAEPDSVEDIEITTIDALRGQWDKLANRHRWIKFDLLKGIDQNDPAARSIVQQLRANVLEYLGQDAAEDALLSEVFE